MANENFANGNRWRTLKYSIELKNAWSRNPYE